MKSDTQNNEKWFLTFFKDNSVADNVLTDENHAMDICKFIKDCMYSDIDGKTAYDMCCGKGTLVHALRKHGCEYVKGVDLCTEYIRNANTFNTDKNIEFRCGDVCDIKFNNQFDIVTMWNSCIGYENENHKNFLMLDALSEALKSNGHFFISTMNTDFVYKHFQKNIVYGDVDNGESILTIRTSNIDKTSDESIPVLRTHWTTIHPDGHRTYVDGAMKMYTLDTLSKELSKRGLSIVNVYGGIDKCRLTDDTNTIIIHGIKK